MRHERYGERWCMEGWDQPIKHEKEKWWRVVLGMVVCVYFGMVGIWYLLFYLAMSR